MQQRFHFIRRLAAVFAAVFVALLAVALTTVSAEAHAAYVSSDPAANTVLKVAPTVVTITFAQNLSPDNLHIVVYGNKGEVVSTGTAQISSTNPRVASVTMKGDDSDIYRVDWNNVSAEDGDPTLGAFVFAVDPSGSSDKVTPETTTTTTTGVAPLVAALIGIVGLLVGAGGVYLATHPRSTTSS